MSETIRLCRFMPGGRCVGYCTYCDRQTNTCRLSPHPPKRWGHGVTVIEIPASEWERGERGSNESSVVEMTIGRPPKHTPTHQPRNMDGASIEELSRALADLNDYYD